MGDERGQEGRDRRGGVQHRGGGGGCKLGDTPTASKLRSQGRRWSQHVLEGPLSWILGTLYIFLTVCLGVTPICAIVSAAIGRSLSAPELDAPVGRARAIPYI
jgi:hypothetical protein